jgi:hypothetical protein
MDAALARMHHGDYVAELLYEAVTGLFRGLRAAFARSVQIHEQTCRDAGREPERPRPIAD